MAGERDVKTTLTLEARTKGFEGAQKRAEKLRDALSTPTLTESFKKFEKHLMGAEKAFDKINTHLARMTRLFGRMERSMDSLLKGMRRAGLGGGPPGGGGGPGGGPFPPGGPGGGGPGGGPAPGPGGPGSGGGPGGGGPAPGGAPGRPKREPSFLQGYLQGVGLGEYIPREGGVRPMLKQAAGRMLGGITRGAMSAPFTGLEGLSTGLQAIPGGGVLAGQLQTAMQNAQQALAVQRTELSMAPMVNFGRADRMADARTKSILAQKFTPTPIPLKTAAEMITDPEIERKTHLPQGQMTRSDVDLANSIEKMRAQREGRKPFLRSFEEVNRSALRKRQDEVARTNAENLRRFEADREKRGSEVAPDFFGGAAGHGQRLMGVSRQEALEFGGQLVRSGGGSFQTAAGQDAMRAAMAAKTAFGVEAGTSGAFLKAGREGGLVGEGAAGDKLARTIGDAMRMGLEGSEINEFLEETASALSEFKSTGMPVNTASIRELGQELGMSGLGVMRGSAVSGQITRAAKQVSTAGPENAAQFQLLQTMGDFKGGGLDALEDSMNALQTGNFKGPGFQEFINRSLAAGGGGAGGRFALRRAFGQIGANLNIDESRLLERVGRGERIEGNDAKKLIDVQERIRTGIQGAPSSTDALDDRAMKIMKRMGGTLQEQAALENERIAIGKKFIGTMLNLEKTTLGVQGAFGKFSGEIEKGTALLQNFSSGIPTLADGLRNLFGLGNVQPGAGGR